MPALLQRQQNAAAVMALVRDEVRERREDSPLEAAPLRDPVEHIAQEGTDLLRRGLESLMELGLRRRVLRLERLEACAEKAFASFGSRGDVISPLIRRAKSGAGSPEGASSLK